MRASDKINKDEQRTGYCVILRRMRDVGKTAILVALHKPYWVSPERCYLPIQVGHAERLQDILVRDNTGDSISVKNPNYCELTALYWAWKNHAAEVYGLVHYRRYFAERRLGSKRQRILSASTLARLLETTDLILPKPRNYFIESTYSHYAHAHHAIDLDVTRQILSERYPEMLHAFDTVMASSKGHRFNLFIMKRPLFERYCTWLFAVLFELERRLDISTYSAYDARVFGFVAERLLDVWVLSERLSYRELPVVYLESQHWGRKIVAFLKRKMGMKKVRE